MKRPDDDSTGPTGLRDTQSEPDHRRIAIDRVGVKNLRFPIRVGIGTGEPQSTIATVQLTADLPHQFKGTHMSRFLEVLHAHGPVLHPGHRAPSAHTRPAAPQRERASRTRISIFPRKKAPVTGAAGLLDYTGRFSATADEKSTDLVTTVVVGVTTLCPCSKAISSSGRTTSAVKSR